MNTSKFRFNLGDQVKVERSDEVGKIVGRSEYTYCASQYLVHYVAADGQAKEGWFLEDELIAD